MTRKFSFEDWVRKCIARARQRGDLVVYFDDSFWEQYDEFRDAQDFQHSRGDWPEAETIRLVADLMPDCRGLSCRGWDGIDVVDALEAHGKKLNNLQELVLAACKGWRDKDLLTALVPQFKHFPELRRLDLSSSGIHNTGMAAFASGVEAGYFQNLTELSLRKNPFGDKGCSSFVRSARLLPNLRVIDFGKTHVGDRGLNALIGGADRLPRLERLDLTGARTTLPAEVLETRQAKTIFQYVRERRVPDAKRLAEFKLLVVGQGRVGKTHLVKWLSETDLYFNRDEPPTHDVNVCQINLDTGLGKVVGRVWDFGGQPELHSTHRFFIGGQRCCYLLVLRADKPADGDDVDANRLRYWLRMISHYGQHQNERAPVLIAVTQCDRKEWSDAAKHSYICLVKELNHRARLRS